MNNQQSWRPAESQVGRRVLGVVSKEATRVRPAAPSYNNGAGAPLSPYGYGAALPPYGYGAALPPYGYGAALPSYGTAAAAPGGIRRTHNGVITCQINQTNEYLPYAVQGLVEGKGKVPRLGDKVTFDICQINRTKEFIAVSVLLHQENDIVKSSIRECFTRDGVTREGGNQEGGTRHAGWRDAGTRDGGTDIRDRETRYFGRRAIQNGFIAAVKDGFGIIETSDHSKEVFFHFSKFEGDPEQLELGSEVEYTVERAGGGDGGGGDGDGDCAGGGGGGGGGDGGDGGCTGAELVRSLPRGTIALAKPLEPQEPPVSGTVTRTLRALNKEQPHYSGLIQTEGGVSYEYGIMGLAYKREILQVGDPVTFQVDTEWRACNIVPVRKKRRATIEAVKGRFGFLSLEMDESQRLCFHMSEMRDPTIELQPGDYVEFVLLTNPRNGINRACNVVKIDKPVSTSRAELPEGLEARIRSVTLEEAGPGVVNTRMPREPDGTRGFPPRGALADHQTPSLPSLAVPPDT